MHTFTTKLETDRLILRPHTVHDIEPSYQMNLDAEVSKYTGDGGVMSKDEITRRIKEDVLGDYKKHGFGRFAIELKESGKFIGFAGLKYLEDLGEVDLGYRLIREHWGKGYATEAAKASIDFGFNQLNLPVIIAMALPQNNASIRVLEKLGFIYLEEYKEDNLLAHKYHLSNENYTT